MAAAVLARPPIDMHHVFPIRSAASSPDQDGGTPLTPAIWTRASTLALAADACYICQGLGMLTDNSPCRCTLKRVFRICYARYRRAAEEQMMMSEMCPPSLISMDGKDSRRHYGRRAEEYKADFALVGLRSLRPRPRQADIFRLHYLDGLDYGTCCAKLKLPKGDFFHEVYRIETRLGRAFAELRPYPLYPLADYFDGERKFLRASE